MSDTLATTPAAPVRADTVEGRLFPSSVAAADNEAKPAAASAEEARAARMFPSMAQPAPAAAPTLATDGGVKPAAGDAKPAPESPGEIVVPREVAELRGSDPERVREEKIYGGTPHDAIVAAVTSDTGTPKHQRTPAVAVEWSKIARDIGLDDTETRFVAQRIGQLRLERANGEAPISREAALKSAIDALSRQFDDPVKAFNDAAALARRDPRVARLLDRTGLGNEAEIIVMLAKRARTERTNRRLK